MGRRRAADRRLGAHQPLLQAVLPPGDRGQHGVDASSTRARTSATTPTPSTARRYSSARRLAYQIFDAKTDPAAAPGRILGARRVAPRGADHHRAGGGARPRPGGAEEDGGRFNAAVGPGVRPVGQRRQAHPGYRAAEVQLGAADRHEPPFYGFAVTCGITFTFGGLRVDDAARVLDGSGGRSGACTRPASWSGASSTTTIPVAAASRGAVFGRRAGLRRSEARAHVCKLKNSTCRPAGAATVSAHHERLEIGMPTRSRESNAEARAFHAQTMSSPALARRVPSGENASAQTAARVTGEVASSSTGGGVPQPHRRRRRRWPGGCRRARTPPQRPRRCGR